MISLVAGLLYFVSIVPLREQMIALGKKKTEIPQRDAIYQYMGPTPANDLPDMTDVPDDAYYGEEGEDYKTTPEEVEDALAERTHNTYNNSRTTSAQQLGSLKM